MYSLYRRHEGDCRYKKKGIRHTGCDCPVWMDGHDENGKRQRRSLKKRSWPHAQARLNEIESGTKPSTEPVRKTPQMADAVDAYLNDCRARKLAASTIISYTNTLGHLKTYFGGKRIDQIDVPVAGFQPRR